MEPLLNDPYRTCDEGRCNHDLARAVSVTELLTADGPHPPSFMVVNLSTARNAVVIDPTLFDSVDEPLEPVRRAI